MSLSPTFAQAPTGRLTDPWVAAQRPAVAQAPAAKLTQLGAPAQGPAVTQAAPTAAQPAPSDNQAPPADALPAPVDLAGPPVVAPAPAFAPLAGGGDAYSAASQRFWVTGEYLFTWFKGDRLPALVTTSPAGTPRSAAGVLGPSSATLFGNNSVNGDLRSGFRLQFGTWIGPERLVGIEAGTMITASQATNFFAASGGTPILARPFTDANTGLPQAVLVAFPGSSAGTVNVHASSGSFYEAHVDLAEKLIETNTFRLTGLVGYRFYTYGEGLNVVQTIQPTGGTFVPGTQIGTVDNFNVNNSFNGVDFGLRSQFFWDKLTVGLLGKIAVGYVHRSVAIAGNQLVMVPGAAPVGETGGVLAQTSNIGRHGSNDFGILPELGANVGWQVAPGVQVQLGYSILWLSRVARAGESVDPTLNPNLFPMAGAAPAGPSRPGFSLDRQTLWIQSLNLGVTFTF
jgi:hypothetical protein